MGCCLGGCLRLVVFSLWRWLAAIALAALLARVDDYVETSGKGGSPAGRAWRLYRRRSGRGATRTTGATAPRVIDTEGRPRP